MCAEQAFMGSPIGMGTDVLPVFVLPSPAYDSEQTSQNTVSFWFKIFSPYLEVLGNPMMLIAQHLQGRTLTSRAT